MLSSDLLAWRRNRRQQRRAAAYAATLLAEPSAEDVSWLSTVGTHGDADHAEWELRYARRAIGLIVAQRNALDDRTEALVARCLTDAFATDRHIAPDRLETAGRQFNARLSAYRDGLAARGGVSATVRLGQTLLAFAGGSFVRDESSVARAGAIVERYMEEAGAALEQTFGRAELPEQLPPSALPRG